MSYERYVRQTGSEIVNVWYDPSGKCEGITVDVPNPDGTHVTVDGNNAIVTDTDGSHRFYKFEKGPAGLKIELQDRDGPEKPAVAIEKDIPLIKGAREMFEGAWQVFNHPR